MKKTIYILVISLLTQNISFALTSEKISRLKYKASNQVAKIAIQNYCSKEDPGLEIDSDIAEQMMFSRFCKCAIKSGKTNDKLIAKNILNSCGLKIE